MRIAPLIVALLLPALAGAKEHPILPAQPAPASGDSIYLLKGSFTDQEGRVVQLADWKGRPLLLSMFYASCPHACPLLISDIKRIERALPEKLRDELRVVLVTFDPGRDTEAALAELAQAHGVDTKRWSFLRTDPERVRELAAVLGIRYRFAKDGSIGHSSVITLLDEAGRIASRIDGLKQPHDDVLRRLRAMLNE